MKTVTLDKLKELQYKTEGIRNICIVAHVDHGKTTLADALVASNGIISNRLAGKLRYMDSRKDEQERGITMKSSSIALYHNIDDKEYLINLIDSPGHVDFSSEVSTAIRLCDGAVVLVDVVEGVCPQTLVALKQAFKENIKPTLVLNKVDRLILELKLSPLDAFIHLSQLLEKVNVVMAELFTTEVMEQDATKLEEKFSSNPKDEEVEYYDWNTGMEDADDSNLYFSPEQGNVIFASATDSWGFRVEDFAKIYSAKLGMKEAVLNKTLWGNFYLNTKQKRVMKGAQEKAKKPLFVQLILENIWAVYDAIAIRKDKLAVENIVKSLSLTIHPRDLKQTDFKSILHSVMGTWLPLSLAVLGMVCSQLPSPLQLSELKVERLMLTRSKKFSALPVKSQALKQDFLQCSKDHDAPIIIFISKMFPVETKDLPQYRPKVLTAEEIAARRQEVRNRIAERQAASEIGDGEAKEIPKHLENTSLEPEEKKQESVSEISFIAFSRVYSGTVKVGQKLYLLGPKHDPTAALLDFPNGEGIEFAVPLKDRKPGQHVISITITSLYLLMGREVESLQEAPAGSIIGIGGLDEFLLKTATLSSSLACPPFTDIRFLADPILRVALEPRHTSDMEQLRLGLKLLNQADPCVQVLVQETGEHVIVTAGEVHLQKCLDDLRERFAKIEISASTPIVPFRETVIEKPKYDMVNEAIVLSTKQKNNISIDSSDTEVDSNGTIVQCTPNKRSIIRMKAVPLPDSIIKILDEYCDLIKILKTAEIDISQANELRSKLSMEFESNAWGENMVDKIWAFGPKHCGPNILINNVPGNYFGSAWPKEFWKEDDRYKNSREAELWNSYSSNFVHGFQLATMAGPLCEEPLRGVGFVVSEWSTNENESTSEGSGSQPYGPFSGQIMSAVKEACRKAFQVQPQRLMVAMYSCNIQVNSEVLGRLYAVLGKRGGRILHGDLQEGSTVFEVTAQLPVIESFDFANEVRRQTSGLALPQLVFSGWETLDIDPFWQPTTEEEYLHFGDKADSENIARKYLNGIRRRKGLHVEEKIVEFGEKQRTLTKNK